MMNPGKRPADGRRRVRRLLYHWIVWADFKTARDMQSDEARRFSCRKMVVAREIAHMQQGAILPVDRVWRVTKIHGPHPARLRPSQHPRSPTLALPFAAPPGRNRATARRRTPRVQGRNRDVRPVEAHDHAHHTRLRARDRMDRSTSTDGGRRTGPGAQGPRRDPELRRDHGRRDIDVMRTALTGPREVPAIMRAISVSSIAPRLFFSARPGPADTAS